MVVHDVAQDGCECATDGDGDQVRGEWPVDDGDFFFGFTVACPEEPAIEAGGDVVDIEACFEVEFAGDVEVDCDGGGDDAKDPAPDVLPYDEQEVGQAAGYGEEFHPFVRVHGPNVADNGFMARPMWDGGVGGGMKIHWLRYEKQLGLFGGLYGWKRLIFY